MEKKSETASRRRAASGITESVVGHPPLSGTIGGEVRVRVRVRIRTCAHPREESGQTERGTAARGIGATLPSLRVFSHIYPL